MVCGVNLLGGFGAPGLGLGSLPTAEQVPSLCFLLCVVSISNVGDGWGAIRCAERSVVRTTQLNNLLRRGTSGEKRAMWACKMELLFN